MQIISVGLRGGKIPVFLDDGSDFRRTFLDQIYVKKALGVAAEFERSEIEDILSDDCCKLRQMRYEKERLQKENEERKREEAILQKEFLQKQSEIRAL